MEEKKISTESKFAVIVNSILFFSIILFNGLLTVFTATFIVQEKILAQYKLLQILIIFLSILVCSQLPAKIFITIIKKLFPKITKGMYEDDMRGREKKYFYRS